MEPTEKANQVLDLSEECDFSKTQHRDYAQRQIQQKPRLLILQSQLDAPSQDAFAEYDALEHTRYVQELAAQQEAQGGGFIVIADRDESQRWLSSPDRVFVPLQVSKFGIISRHDGKAGIYTNVQEIEDHLQRCSRSIIRKKGKKPVSYGQSVGSHSS